MIWVVQKGGNYGWSVQEGSHPFHPHKKAGPGPILPPVVEHHHTECRSITGGYVYHGEKFPELRGAYVYGDYQYGKIWGLRYDGQKVTWHEELADTAVFIASFAVGRDGDIYAIDNTTGFLHALERTPPGSAASAFPRTLGETGLFASVADRRPAPGVIPYSVNAPGWSDGAHAERYLALPGETPDRRPERAGPTPTAWSPSRRSRSTGRRATRGRGPRSRPGSWSSRTSTGWATPTSGTTRGPTRRSSGPNGADPVLDHQGPRRARRHPAADLARPRAQRVHVLPLARGRVRPGPERVADEQGPRLRRRRGQPAPRPRPHRHLQDSRRPRLAPPRCPGSSTRTIEEADLTTGPGRISTSTARSATSPTAAATPSSSWPTRTSSRTPRPSAAGPCRGRSGSPTRMIIAPGEPERSVLYYRMASLGGARMPRVGSRVVDEKALDMLHDWIARMPDPGRLGRVEVRSRGDRRPHQGAPGRRRRRPHGRRAPRRSAA